MKDKPNYLYFAVALVMTFIVFFADRHVNINMNWFYVLPVAYIAWCSKSISITILSTVISTFLFSFQQYSSVCPPYFLWDSIVNVSFYIISGTIIIKLKKLLDREKGNARTDFLTGLKNKQGFHESLVSEKERFCRNEKPFTVAFLDLDNFKTVNDNFGHDAGDNLLVNIAKIIISNIRKYDIAARLGGDEFALLLVESDPVLVEQRLQKLRDTINVELKKIHSETSVSVGAVTYTKREYIDEDMIKEADIEMYLIKRNGKNGINHIVK